MIEEATSSKHSDTTDAPLVSVVAPCFNAEKYLEEALRSIYEQDYPNFEVIIVDDGSTDNSYAMLEQLQKVHGFQLYRQQNQGVSAALNFGLRHARGDYVATPDLDDIMLPHSLSVRAAYLDQHPEVGCVGALVIYIDSEGQETKRQNGNRIRQLDFDYLLGNAYVCGAPVSLYRMEALRAAGFYDPEIKVQDFQMTLRIASQGYQIHKLPVLVTRYRRHPDN
ncbi:TPA: alpha-1,6-rhamnosyltransferase, partial [Pseudomonas aeruginosa]